eukprot:NODE_1891_length_2343_cov_7.758123.p1 GENE.NODE_1891_length_2343_cov_7.758123~~NODE_1891_length_2343_cov_7.758123.p1  ORF type:complete len:628 (-),score=60.35 NODE_1891_length_2343_cov_7.758123:224-2107(-)
MGASLSFVEPRHDRRLRAGGSPSFVEPRGYKRDEIIGSHLSDVSNCSDAAGLAKATGVSTKEAQDVLATLVEQAANSVRVAVQAKAGKVAISVMPRLQCNGTYAVELTAVCSYAKPSADWFLLLVLQCPAWDCISLEELINVSAAMPHPHPNHDNRLTKTLASIRAWAEPCLSKLASQETRALMHSVLSQMSAGAVSRISSPPIARMVLPANSRSFLFAVVRHGERADFASKLTMGADVTNWPHDPALTDTGTAQAKLLANRLLCACEASQTTFNIVVSSPYKRCVRTALLICQQLPSAMLVIDRSIGEVYGPAALSNNGEREPLRVTRPPQQVLEECSAVSHASRYVGRWPVWPETRQAAKARYTVAFLSYVDQAMRRCRNFVFVTHAVCVETALQLLAGDHMMKSVGYCGSLIVTDRAALIKHKADADVKSSLPALAGNGSVNSMVTLQTHGIAVADHDGSIGIIGRNAMIASSGCSAVDACRLLNLEANDARMPDRSNSNVYTLSPPRLEADSEDGLCHSASNHRRHRQRSDARSPNSWHAPEAERVPVRRTAPADLHSLLPTLPAVPCTRKARKAATFDLTVSSLYMRRASRSTSASGNSDSDLTARDISVPSPHPSRTASGG